MISTFVSLAALVAGAPLSLDAASGETAIAEPVVIETPASIQAEREKPAKPLPLVLIRAPQAAEQDTETESGPPRSEVLEALPIIPPPSEADPTQDRTTDSEAPDPGSNAAESEEAGTNAAVPTDDMALDPPSAAETAILTDPAPIADPTQVSPTEQRAILKAAAGALGAVETARGRFSQLDPTGTRAAGSFALQRPGRMRFDYDDPVPILIAADGTTVAVRDDELETVDRVPLAATPLNLLLDDRLDFETEAEVIRVIKANGQVAITMRDRTGEADGELTLFLDSASYDLMAWQTLDGNDRLTYVELRDVDTGVRLNPRLFIIDDYDEDEDDDRR